MEKTELMKKYEIETGKQSAIVKFMAGGQALETKTFPKLGPFDYSVDYISWLEEKLTKSEELFRNAQDLTDFVRRDKNKKIEKLEIDLQIAITRANALQNAFDRLLAKKLTDEELDSSPASKILKEMAEKAEAYDRLMSGESKMTMQEMANFIGRPITANKEGGITAHGSMPRIVNTWLGECWYNEADEYMEINESFVDFSGDWTQSLTLPDGWEAK
jgi:hypothetical protein